MSDEEPVGDSAPLDPTAPIVAPLRDARQKPSLKRTSVLLLIVLTFISLGPYYLVWFLRRRRGLNQLDSPRKLKAWPFIFGIVLVFAQVVFTMATPSTTGDAPQRPEFVLAGAVLSLAQFAFAILMLVQQFHVKSMIEDHLAGTAENAVFPRAAEELARLSGLMTFFFGIFYLQHVINTRVLAAVPQEETLQLPAGG